MIDPEKANIIFGPPGTGKTTRLIAIVEELVKADVSTEEIIFVAFTKKAAHEAVTRAMHKFGLKLERFPWFRTLHSLAFGQLGLRSIQVMSGKDYCAIAKLCRISITSKWSFSGELTYQGAEKGDQMLHLESMARARAMGLEALYKEQVAPEFHWEELKHVSRTMLAYKRTEKKLDFVDMIYAFNEKAQVLKHVVLIVDEAQDLSLIQWKMVDKIAETSVKVFIAGDDDQAIFAWAGADPKRLVEMPGERTVLPKSYRVPSKIQDVAFKIISRIKGPRTPKQWTPFKDGGEVKHEHQVGAVPLEEGRWLILSRNLQTVERMATYCAAKGLLFESQVGEMSQISRDMIRGVNAWEMIRRTQEVTVEDAVLMYELMMPRTGYIKGMKQMLDREDPAALTSYEDLKENFGLLADPKKTWDKVLDRMNPSSIERLRGLRRTEITAEDFKLPEPTIRISTIHAAKGGEEDNVLLSTDMSKKVWDSYKRDPDPEHRVWYVATTRAKNRLVILKPQTQYFYEL